MNRFRTYRNAWRLILALLCTGLLPAALHAQDAGDWRDSIAKAPHDTIRANYYTAIARFYMHKPGEVKNDLDSAWYFLDKALKISKQYNIQERINWNHYYIANLYLDLKTPWRVNEIMPLLPAFQQSSLYANLSFHYAMKPGEFGDDLDTAIIYGKKALYMAKPEKIQMVTEHAAHGLVTAFIERRQSHEALAYLDDLSPTNHYKVLYYIGGEYLGRRAKAATHLDSAELYTKQSIEMGKRIKASDMHVFSYYNLSLIEYYRNRYDRIPAYIRQLTGVQKAEISIILANWYLRSNGNPDSARAYAQLSIDAYQSIGQTDQQSRGKKIIAALDALNANRQPVSARDAQSIRSLIALGRQYQSGYPLFDANQQSIAINYFHSAIQQADHLRLDSLSIEARIEIAKTFCMFGDTASARDNFNWVIDKYAAQKNHRKIAETWAHFGSAVRRQRPHYAQIASAYTKAMEHFAAAGSRENELLFGLEAANYLNEDAQQEAARNLLLQLSHKFVGTTPSAYKLSRHFALLAQLRGDHSAALKYTTEGLRQSVQQHDTLMTNMLLTRMAEIYRDMGQHEKSIETYWQVLVISPYKPLLYDYYAVVTLTELLIQYRSPAEALAFVQQVYQKQPPVGYYPQRLLECAQGLCYEALGKPAEAEMHFHKGINNIDGIMVGDRYYSLVNFYLGRFYLHLGKFTLAAEHLRKALRFQPDIASVALTNNTHHMLFRCDSALGNYRDAIGHFQLYKYYTDSLFNVTKSKQISELQIQYETEKKDQSLLLQEQQIKLSVQNIQLLTKQGQLQKSELQQAVLERQQSILDARQKDQNIRLKEQDIQLLTRKSQLDQNKLEQERLMRNVSFGGAGLLVLIIGLLVHGYRLKQQHNLSLQEKQNEIGQKNQSLEKLLTEKEWLLKEIHHRVKNNLQIVMSLLNSQSAFLQNDAALVAIRDSQHRVQAISLIHKKLYQSDNMGVIYMPHYIHELVDYLRDCFDSDRNVQFRIHVALIHLDVSQAVPLGLILNEAITNAIKYAFPDNREGIIDIHLEPGDDGHYALTIADNGKGLPDGFDINRCHSLGMSLMQGLSDDLGGQFSIRDIKGVEIRIRFANDTFAHPVLSLKHENIAV